MNIMDYEAIEMPVGYEDLLQESKSIGFDQPSDVYIGTLLKTLLASKPKGNFLELGTGASLSMSWMLAGMDKDSNLVSLDNDTQLIAIAEKYFGKDPRLQLFCTDGAQWIKDYTGEKFDLIFADTWPGKYNTVEETLALLKPGGMYLIDDMKPQPNWPEGHAEKAKALVDYLEKRGDLVIAKMDWSTGVLLATKTG